MIDVLVVGAGPTGLTLAVELARRGIAHRVIEAAEGPQIGSRGKGLQPRSLEILDDLGVIDEILATGRVGLDLRLYQDGQLMTELATATGTGARPGVPYPDLVLLPEWRVERVLRERHAELGGSVDFATELVDLEQDNDGVTATLRGGERVRARYLVGADGGHSTVRKLLGAGMAGRTHDDQYFLVGDVIVEGLADDASYAWFGEGGSYLALSPLPHADGAWQYQANVIPDPTVPEPSLEIFRELFAQRSGRTDVTLTGATWLSRYRFNARMVEHYRHGRVFLAGDAAHVHSPAGGQGMNTGIGDAYNLGWKLAAILDGAADTLLDTYELERRPVAAAVLAGSSRGFETVFALTGVRRLLRDHLVFPLLKIPAITRRLLDKTSQLSISYGDASHARRGPSAGDRAPDARGSVRLFDLLRGTHWTLLSFGDQAPTIAGVRTQMLHRRTDAEAYRLYRAQPGTLVLIRPDGHIAARTKDAQEIVDYLAVVRTAESAPPSLPANTASAA
ncbi:FAD-dependent monooxygenase [Nonomuraea sp. CA-143628]|uniref:FAD-dependent monooxygenase n=1 Tax=Nonomuraea sp. CA-143628 TaxID=3239997 RepID=UPI003D8D7ACA